MAGVAEGLAAVHAAGIVHRDLTPANVLLAADGPRVIDFGIAHDADATSLTRTGMLVGTPAFLAPEQIRGRSATPATDVYALGNLAVFAATGHAAFGEGNQDALLYRIVNEPPDLDDCPADIRAIVVRCLAKDPAIRPDLTEITDYAGEHLEPAGSWLPPGHRGHPRLLRRRPIPRTAVYPQPPTLHRTPRRRSARARVAAVALVTVVCLGGGVAVGYAVNRLDGHLAQPGSPATTSPSESCSEAFNAFPTARARGNPNGPGGLAAIYQAAALAEHAAGAKTTDAVVRSAVDRLAGDYTTAAENLRARDNPSLRRTRFAITADVNALRTACG